MKTQTRKHGGAYLQVPSQKRRFSKFILLGGIFIAVGVIILFVFSKTEDSDDKIVYRLPDEVPVISLPDDLEDNSSSLVLEDLVLPHFDFTIEAGSNSIKVSLPLIQASFGENFNSTILSQLNSLVSNTLFYLEQDICIVESMTYDAYLDQAVSTILLHTNYTDGQSRCEPWIFDLSNGGEPLETWEFTERLLGIDYATFLWVTDRYIQNQFADTYFEQAYAASEDDMSYEQHDFLEDYRGIFREIPDDLGNTFSRWIFPANGKVFLAVEHPIITADWYSGFRSETRIAEIDASILRYADMITPRKAVLDAVLNSTVHVMGATDQIHAQLTRILFFESPFTFVDAISTASESDQAYAIKSLLRYADENEQAKILAACRNLKRNNYLTNSATEAIDRIISEIDNHS